MTDKVQKIREEVERLMTELIQGKEKGFGSDVYDACILELQNVLIYIDSLQEEQEPIDLGKALYDHFGMVKDFSLGLRIARHFYEMGKQHQEESREQLYDKLSESLKDSLSKETKESWEDFLSEGSVSKVDEYIKKYTRNCSNELVYDESYPSLTDGIPLYEPWLTPFHAEAVAQIAREEVIEKAVEDEPNHIDWLINVEVVDAEKKELKKVEQKPTEDGDLPEFESYLCLMFQKFRTKGMCTNGEIIDYVKEHSQKLKDILVKPAWSDEDERKRSELISILLADHPDRWAEYADWLKSLRPQNRWKPSDEQIGVIEAVINNRSFQRRHLDSLYKQLKKLREE